MRTTKLKNEKKEVVLIAGGLGFKIYSSLDYSGWIITTGHRTFLVEEYSLDFTIVNRYVNLKYQPSNKQQDVRNKFDQFLLTKKEASGWK